VDDITAGSAIVDKMDELGWDSRPNRAPMACGILNVAKFYSKDTATTYLSTVDIDDVDKEDMKVVATNIHGFAYCDGFSSEPFTKTMVGTYLFADSASEEEREIEAIIDGGTAPEEESTVEAGDALDDESLVQEPTHREDAWMNTEHYLINAVIAAAIICCGCLVMGYVAVVYCLHKRKQKDTEERALIFKQQRQSERVPLWVKRNQTFTLHYGHDTQSTLDIAAHSGQSTSSSSSSLALSSERTPLLNSRTARSDDELPDRPTVDRINTV